MTKKVTVEQLAEMTNKHFGWLEQGVDVLGQRMDVLGQRMDVLEENMATKEHVKDVLEAIDNLGGRIDDVKQSTVSALDHVRLEHRVEILEDELQGIKDNRTKVGRGK